VVVGRDRPSPFAREGGGGSRRPLPACICMRGGRECGGGLKRAVPFHICMRGGGQGGGGLRRPSPLAFACEREGEGSGWVSKPSLEEREVGGRVWACVRYLDRPKTKLKHKKVQRKRGAHLAPPRYTSQECRQRHHVFTRCRWRWDGTSAEGEGESRWSRSTTVRGENELGRKKKEHGQRHRVFTRCRWLCSGAGPCM
jgi:hypothetical protein